jgi:hypothetical protein
MPAHIGIVNHIVMNQCGCVNHLHHGRQPMGRGPPVGWHAAQTGGEQQQDRTNPFTLITHHMVAHILNKLAGIPKLLAQHFVHGQQV